MIQKTYLPVLSFLLLLGSIYIAYDFQTPDYLPDATTAKNEFSVDRALIHLKKISEQPHYVGTNAHAEVRNYLVEQLEKMGLQPHVQIQEVFNDKWHVGTQTYNVLARIKGTDNTSKAVMLLSHYDSSPHASLGASDAGSGVVTILEGVSAFLNSGKQAKNDIIILISDAEELGLLGAKAFVNHHPWAKDVGLVINFEARGSGGPSYMLLETNGGNANLIKAFGKAHPSHAVGNSLMYSVYKMLPNDTDLTIFREDGNIDGFNFAFIDDHFDYHSQQDSFERLNKNTLLHQGSYCTAMLNYFANANLNTLKNEKDFVYFNFPFIGVIYYPFDWILPIVVVLSFVFVLLVFRAFQIRKINLKNVLKGFVPFLLSLVFSIIMGVLGWKLILWLAPDYKEILHGFPYNGKWLIIGFLTLTTAIFWKIYTPYFNKRLLPDLLVAPLLFWIIINFLTAFLLKGAAFLAVPLLFLLITWAILIVSNKINGQILLVFTLLAIPATIILTPMLYMFPVGLGLKNIVISTVLLVLWLSTLLGVFEFYNNHKALQVLFAFMALLSFGMAMRQGKFNENQKYPNSVLYFAQTDTQEAFFASYDHKTDIFTEQFLTENPQKGDLSSFLSSKYKTPIRLYQKTKWIDFEPPTIFKSVNDSSYTDKSVWEYTLKKTRNTAQWYLSVNDTLQYYDLTFNNVSTVKNDTLLLKTKINTKLGSYFLTPQKDSLRIKITVPKGHKPQIDLYDISYDLFENHNFKFSPRHSTMMPKPFVINDAIVLKINL